MKSVLITFDQAYYERIMALLDRLGCRGFTYLEKVQGRGSKTGDPHFGSHAWPSMCSAILTVVDDSKVDPLLDTLHIMVPGSGYYGSLCSVCQAQLSREGCERDSENHARGISHRFHGQAGTGTDRCAERCAESAV